MEKSDSERYQSRINSLLTALEQALSTSAFDADAIVVLDQSSVGRVSRMDAMQQKAMAGGFRDTLLRDKRKLAAALVRLREGTFGLCCNCGAQLSTERLDADPGAPFCTGCQQEIETRKNTLT